MSEKATCRECLHYRLYDHECHHETEDRMVQHGYQRLKPKPQDRCSDWTGKVKLSLVCLALVLPACASYEVTCTPDGGKHIDIASTREISESAVQITEGCGINAVVGSASGVQGLVESLPSLPGYTPP